MEIFISGSLTLMVLCDDFDSTMNLLVFIYMPKGRVGLFFTEVLGLPTIMFLNSFVFCFSTDFTECEAKTLSDSGSGLSL